MIFVITGAPGAGKGTQAALMVEELGLAKLSTGDALRKQIKDGSEIGMQAKSFMDNGRLVPDDVLLGVLRAELEKLDGQDILLDGYPRNVAQAKTLENLSHVYPVAGVIHLKVGRETLLERLSGRRVCDSCGATYHTRYSPVLGDTCTQCGGTVVQRPDDRAEKVATRLDIYESETLPVLDFYRQKGIYSEVEGEADSNEVFRQVKDVLKKIASGTE